MAAVRDRLPIKIGVRKYSGEIESITWEPYGGIARVQDTGAEPTERSIENDGLWLRTGEDFQLGAGQRYFDRASPIRPSQRERFRWSKGLDVLDDERRAQLLNTVTSQTSIGDGSTGLFAEVGGYLYAASGAAVERSDASDPETWTACTSEPGSTITGIASVGSQLYVCDGANVSELTAGGTGFSSFSTENTTYLIGGAGRLLGLEANGFWEFTAGGAKPASGNIHTHFNSGFIWRGGVAAPNGIYIFGDSGSESEVYLLIPVDATGTLPPPYPVMQDLPKGELIRQIYHHAGIMVLATSKGVRLASIGGAGTLSFGPLTALGDVLGIGFAGGLLYASWTDFEDADGTSDDTGVAVIDLSIFTRTLTPAYASSYMIGTTTGTVRAVAYFADRVCFIVDDTVNGNVWVQDTATVVASGELRTGGITYTTPQFMAVSSVELDTDPLPAGSSVDVELLHRISSTDSELFDSMSKTGATAYIQRQLGPLSVEEPELKLTLNRSTATTDGPVLRRWTLRAVPMIKRSERIVIPVLLADTVADDDEGHEVRLDVLDELLYLRGLAASQNPISCAIADYSFLARVEGVRVAPGRLGPGLESLDEHSRGFAHGTWYVALETISDAATGTSV